MFSYLFLALILLISGFFLIFRISFIEFIEDIMDIFSRHNKSIYKMQKNLKRKESKNPFVILIKEVKYVLEKTNRINLFSTLVIISSIGLCFSIFVSILLSNIFLLLPLTASFVMLPFVFVKFTSRSYEILMKQEIETALSIITTSYLRTDDIVSAIKENAEYLNPPVKDVFDSFLLQQRLIQSNIELAILNMKDKLNNSVFEEWCDTLCACQRDRTIKHILPSIVSKLSDTRTVNAELEILMYEPVKELVLVMLLAVANIPFLYFLHKDWFYILFNTTIGKFLVALNILACFISLIGLVVLNKPIELKR